MSLEIPLNRNQAITALTLTDLLEHGYPSDHPAIATFRGSWRDRSMLTLDANRRQPVRRWRAGCLGASICATVGANLAHGLGNGPIGALVSA